MCPRKLVLKMGQCQSVTRIVSYVYARPTFYGNLLCYHYTQSTRRNLRLNLRPNLLLLVGVASVSFAAIFIRLADAPPLIIAAYRMGIASLLILPFTYKRVMSSLGGFTRRTIILIILAGVFLSAHFVLWITSLEHTSVASSVVLVTANPVFVAIASYLLWKEKLGRLSILGIIIAICGVIVISQGEFSFGSEVFLGNTLALVAGLLAASYLMVARALRDHIDAVSYLVSVYAVSAVILLVSAVVAGMEFTGYSATTYLMLVLLAVIPQ
ncbi:MAG: EamA family transporter [Candidatus Brocadiia bacterium]|nr:MAG: EamA family transporter [Candidatus Brocadiia bacterium]